MCGLKNIELKLDDLTYTFIKWIKYETPTLKVHWLCCRMNHAAIGCRYQFFRILYDQQLLPNLLPVKQQHNYSYIFLVKNLNVFTFLFHERVKIKMITMNYAKKNLNNSFFFASGIKKNIWTIVMSTVKLFIYYVLLHWLNVAHSNATVETLYHTGWSFFRFLTVHRNKIRQVHFPIFFFIFTLYNIFRWRLRAILFWFSGIYSLPRARVNKSILIHVIIYVFV